MSWSGWRIVIHGGAGVSPGRDYRDVETHMLSVVGEVGAMLKDGAAAIDAVQRAVSELERSGLYVAGRGAATNSAGVVELDASIMDGDRHCAGGVCAAVDLESPVAAARAVMEHSPHVLLAGAGAVSFAKQHGVRQISDPSGYYRVPAGVEEEEMAPSVASGLSHGTVGAVAIDRHARLASATSTGGLFGKLAGRIGDTPLPAIGTWADRDVAISCTGIGEAFILAGGAYDMVARMKYGGESLEGSARALLASVAVRGGDGGLIALSATGEIVAPYNSLGLKHAAAGDDFPAYWGIA